MPRSNVKTRTFRARISASTAAYRTMQQSCGLLLFTALVIFGIVVLKEFFALATPPDPLARQVNRSFANDNEFTRRVIALWRLLFEARWIIGSIMTIPLAHCFVGLHEADPRDAVKTTGLILQVFGLLLVFHQLARLRGQFNRQSYMRLLLDWLWRLGRVFKIGKPQHRAVSAADGVSISVSASDGELWLVLNLDESKPLQDQIRHLAAVIENHEINYNQRFKKLRKELTAANSRIGEVAGSTRESKEELSRVIEKVTIGDHALELLGLFWLVVGVIFSTIPEVIARLIP